MILSSGLCFRKSGAHWISGQEVGPDVMKVFPDAMPREIFPRGDSNPLTRALAAVKIGYPA